jgi:asparagine synthase (glutamine-hydrolysing)
MQTLLDRKDRMSMYHGLEVRVPFCDHRIAEYLYSVPWEMKDYQGKEKGLLRCAMAEFLPSEVLWRKKSPYPKTHNPEYLKEVLSLLDTSLKEGGYLSECLDKEKLREVITSGGTWFGQLMDAPQLVAWLVQFDIWAKHYNIDFVN